MRHFVAWLVGILVFIALGVALARAGDALGVPSSIELDEPTTVTRGSGPASYDEEVSSLQTSFGTVSAVMSFLAALWAGQAVFHRSIRAGFSRKGWYSFMAWLIASLPLLVVSALTHFTFVRFNGPVAYYARMLIEVGAAVGIGWAAHQWYKNRVAGIKVEGEA